MLGVFTAVVFFLVALTVIPRGAGVDLGCIYGIALCSPAVMLGVDRGNVDLLVFVVVVAALSALRSRRKPVVAPALILFAAVLKLFPIIASIVLLRSRDRRARLALIGVLLGFGIYAAATLGTIREILRVLPQSSLYSYGVKPFGKWAQNVFGTYHVHLPSTAWEVLTIGLAVLVSVLTRAHIARHLSIEDDDTSAELDLFTAGATIYLATFLLVQSFDYRLVFLLLVLPQLARWSRHAALGAVGSALVLFTLWLGPAWTGVPVVATILDRWEWLTSQRPLFGVDQPLAADASVQLLLAVVLILLLTALTPRILHGHTRLAQWRGLLRPSASE